MPLKNAKARSTIAVAGKSAATSSKGGQGKGTSGGKSKKQSQTASGKSTSAAKKQNTKGKKTKGTLPPGKKFDSQHYDIIRKTMKRNPWTSAAKLQSILYKKTGLDVSESSISKVRHKLGCPPAKPRFIYVPALDERNNPNSRLYEPPVMIAVGDPAPYRPDFHSSRLPGGASCM
ncbi:uncharacterized protein LOC106159003 [Lingula anatina]|uniref:Uncharacterized protein LOC106159003 n=1 Tax=Lingula anatina TaxID=7574 RepID=A0A1S3HX40_LINAN|nr:uncharacterized protein LOC106159003 [Lingula anatina]|eukprot:XP_013390612.1 uncharacterized protein LOC106159003 [Lingula anatina]